MGIFWNLFFWGGGGETLNKGDKEDGASDDAKARELKAREYVDWGENPERMAKG